MTFSEVIALRLVSADPERLIDFYRALGFETGQPRDICAEEMSALGLSGTGRRWPMTIGRQAVDIDAFSQKGRAYPAGADAAALVFQHFALRTGEIEAMWERAQAAGAVPISREGPVTLPASAGGVTAVKFRDPQGHPLEFLQFPADGQAKAPSVRGIDHTAISVADVQASLAFYAAHGLRRGEGSLNQGPTQVALDGLEDVVVEVTPLLPGTRTPHLELLGYRRPRGRASPPPRPNDVASTRIVWRAGRHALLADPDEHLHQLCP